MPTKHATYNLGAHGVVLTPTEVHRPEGSLRSAQNAIFSLDGSEGGLRKRGGLTKLTSSTLAGTVRGLVNVPLDDPDDLTLLAFAPIDAGSGNTWDTSSDGDTWTGASTLTRVVRTGNLTAFTHVLERFLLRVADGSQTQVFYPTHDYTPGTDQPSLLVTNGTYDVTLFTPPNTTGASDEDTIISGVRYIDPYVYFTARAPNSANTVWQAYRLNTETGRVQRVGAPVSETGTVFVADLVIFNGRLWSFQVRPGAGGYGAKSIEVPTDEGIEIETSWTAEYTDADDMSMSAAVYQGNLYVGTSNGISPGSVTPKVFKITPGSAVSTSDSGSAGGSNASAYGGLIVYQDELYAARWVESASAMSIRKFDGSSWTEDLDVTADFSNAEYIGQSMVDRDDLYFCFPSTTAANGAIYRKRSGTWSRVSDGVAYRGPLARTLT